MMEELTLKRPWPAQKWLALLAVVWLLALPALADGVGEAAGGLAGA
jgi:hypothetical protein